MARTRVRWGRVGALLAGAGVALTVAASAAQAGGQQDRVDRPQSPAVRTYVVRPGDTLWGIASRLAGPEADPRPVVDALAAANRVDGQLAVGARLVLPA
jgi:Tfp pilus assembly protein FimV